MSPETMQPNPEQTKNDPFSDAQKEWEHILREPMTEPGNLMLFYPKIRIVINQVDYSPGAGRRFSNYRIIEASSTTGQKLNIEIMSTWLISYLDQSVKAARNLPRDGKVIDGYLEKMRANMRTLKNVARQPIEERGHWVGFPGESRIDRIDDRRYLPKQEQEDCVRCIDAASSLIEKYVDEMRMRPSAAMGTSEVLGQLPLPSSGAEPVRDDLPLPSEQSRE